MDRKKKSKENMRLEKQKIARRKRYAQIKEDPVLYELEKEKEKRRYQKRKDEKKIVSVNEESPRDQREKRKKWREASKKYRQNKKEDSKKKPEIPEVVLIDPTITDSEKKEASYEDPLKSKESPQVEVKLRRIRYLEQKKRKCLMRIIKKLKEENNQLKVKLNNIYKEEKKINEKNKEGSAKETKKVINTEKSKEYTRIQQLVKKVRTFYLDDLNSTVGAGKKEYMTRLKVQKQKRYMTSTQKVLHQKFMTKYQVKVSYSFFCKHRPFWVLTPKSAQRDTCKCIIHENIDLMTKALKTSSIIDESNCDALMNSMCCSIYEEKCLRRECQSCKDKLFQLKEFSDDQDITYFKWIRAREMIKTKKGQKVITNMKKEEVRAKPRELINALIASLPAFFKHIYTIHNQYISMKKLKDSTPVTCAVIHADFSENYGLKFNKEVQSMHFGGSRKEVSLHTAIIYSFDFATSSIKPKSICTTSSCLRHDAPAVWAHFIPLIQQTIKDNPFIDTIHIQTDSPTSQYRNKYIFHMIPQIHKEFPQINTITWNYTEAGHGKGAADGVGGTIKRTVDSCVNHGIDVGSYDQFMRVCRENIRNVTMFDVSEESISEIEKKIPENLQSFRGTLEVHQVLWKKGIPNLTFRNASCFECDCGITCTHGKHLGFMKIPESLSSSPIPDTEVKPLIATKSNYGNAVFANITNTMQASTSTVANICVNGVPSNIKILSNKRIIIKKSEIFK